MLNVGKAFTLRSKLSAQGHYQLACTPGSKNGIESLKYWLSKYRQV
ncbi:hypothetical protein SOHN41_00310 [Shewanella sp. HN-41]|nr:hypothetical protein SOHN41_00310 [Shewanella sp. HN-41]